MVRRFQDWLHAEEGRRARVSRELGIACVIAALLGISSGIAVPFGAVVAVTLVYGLVAY